MMPRVSIADISLEEFAASRPGPFGLVSHQASDAAWRLRGSCGGRLAALFSPEHGFFGSAGAGEKTASCIHPDWGIPVHSLYGETRKPSRETLEGLSFLVFSLQDIAVRCFTYLGTLKYVLEAAAESGTPVAVDDRPVPAGGVVDGLGLDGALASFVAPLDVPFCHGMTPGEAAVHIARAEKLDIDLSVLRVEGWSHACKTPWPGFIPPSPAIRSWDCAVAYPALVFTEAFPALDCDRSGPLAFRFLSFPGMRPERFASKANSALRETGFSARPFTAPPSARGAEPRPGVLLSAERDALPATAGFALLSLILEECGERAAEGARPEWLDKLCGRRGILGRIEAEGWRGLARECALERKKWKTRRTAIYPGAEAAD